MAAGVCLGWCGSDSVVRAAGAVDRRSNVWVVGRLDVCRRRDFAAVAARRRYGLDRRDEPFRDWRDSIALRRIPGNLAHRVAARVPVCVRHVADGLAVLAVRSRFEGDSRP